MSLHTCHAVSVENSQRVWVRITFIQYAWIVLMYKYYGSITVYSYLQIMQSLSFSLHNTHRGIFVNGVINMRFKPTSLVFCQWRDLRLRVRLEVPDSKTNNKNGLKIDNRFNIVQ